MVSGTQTKVRRPAPLDWSPSIVQRLVSTVTAPRVCRVIADLVRQRTQPRGERGKPHSGKEFDQRTRRLNPPSTSKTAPVE